MITASIARENAERANTDTEPENIEQVYKALEEAANAGEFQLKYQFDFDEFDFMGIQAFLGNLGYKTRFLYKTDYAFTLNINW